MTSTTKDLIRSQAILAVSLVVCVLLKPAYLFEADQGGVSNYGVQAITVVPFTLGFLGSSWLIARAARRLLAASGFRRLLLLVSLAQLFALATTYPYKLSHGLDLLHILSAVILFWVELGETVWLLRNKPDSRMLAAGGLFLLGILLSALTFAGILHILFFAEVLTSFAFGMLIIFATPYYDYAERRAG